MRSHLFCFSITLLCLVFVCSSYGLRINKRVVESSFDDDKVETTTNVVSQANDEGVVIAFDESKEDPVVETTTQVPQEQEHFLAGSDSEVPENNGDFQYPVTPDPASPDEEFVTVPSVPDDFNINQLENANITRLENATNFNRFIVGRASCACGVPAARIVGGDPEQINKLPWTAALVRGSIYVQSRPYCGGTLINSRYVVTASHCVDGMRASGISVRLNQENVYASSRVQAYGVSKIIMHPNYNRGTIDNDIALLQLSQPVKLEKASPVVPACLPASSNINIDSYTAIAAGWGATAQGGSTSSVLRKVEVPIMSNERCNRESKYNGRITQNMLCAGLMDQGGKDSCQGDSGGPLIIQNVSRGTLVGVVSWGYGCAQAKAPGVYARVSRYPDWILANTRDADWCDG